MVKCKIGKAHGKDFLNTRLLCGSSALCFGIKDLGRVDIYDLERGMKKNSSGSEDKSQKGFAPFKTFRRNHEMFCSYP